jgi:HrpA-like RNA helicase
MPLPTLARKGKLRDPLGRPDVQAQLDEITPIDHIIDWFRQRITRTGVRNRVLILKAMTASGKSTYFLGELNRRLIKSGAGGAGAVCTQPRILTAIRNVFEILKYYRDDLRLGDTIGYSAGGRKIPTRNPGIMSVTVGTLALELKSSTDEQIMSKYRFILVDETHERSIEIDTTLYMLKNFLSRVGDNPRCPFVVCMSATFDPAPFVRYFMGADSMIGADYRGAPTDGQLGLSPADSAAVGVSTAAADAATPVSPVSRTTGGYNPLAENQIVVEGESHPIEKHWDWNAGRVVNDYARAAAECVRRIVTAAPDEPSERADVLIFMPGGAEFKATRVWLDRLNSELARSDLPVFTVLSIDREAVNSRSHDYQMLDVPVERQRVSIDTAIAKHVPRGGMQSYRAERLRNSAHDASDAGTVGGATVRQYTPHRRVILSTNVAETGLTLANLKYVIDGGFNRETEFNPNFGTQSLLTKPAPQSRITQRMGRAGRNFPGEFYPLYPMYIYERLPKQQLPQILLEDVSGVLMDVMSIGTTTPDLDMRADIARAYLSPNRNTSALDPNRIDMLDPPSGDAILYALDKLNQLGFVTAVADSALVAGSPAGMPTTTEYASASANATANAGAYASAPAVVPEHRLTELGAIATKLQTPPECARMILAGFVHNCSIIDLITIAVGVGPDLRAQDDEGKKMTLNWDSIYRRAFADTGEKHMRLVVSDEFIDFLILVEAVKRVAVETPDRTKIAAWCRSVGVNYSSLLIVLRDRDDLIQQSLGASIAVFSMEKHAIARTIESDMAKFSDTVARIKYCIYDGFRRNAMTLRTGRYYANGLEVQTPKIYGQDVAGVFRYTADTLPRTLLYSKISIRPNLRDPAGAYVVSADRVSQMDGYVAVDAEFAN